MVNYCRNRLPGGTYFFTVTLRDRWSRPLVQHIDLLREAFRVVREQRSFDVDAIVILPDHLHAVWTLPEGDADYPGRWRAIKSRFSRPLLEQGVKLQRTARGDYALWQRCYWEHTIRGDDDRQRHVDYSHNNPVKHRLVRQVMDWPFSSFHRFVREGLLSPDWAGRAMANVQGEFGE